MGYDSRLDALVQTAFIWAQQSTCSRLSVGCVIAREGRILVQGYNGAPAGMDHCPPEHEPEQCLSVHAEQNAIAFAAKWGVALDGSEMVVTHQPCLSCARSIINAGIRKVYYAEPYRLQDGLELLGDAGVWVCRVRPLSDKVDK